MAILMRPAGSAAASLRRPRAGSKAAGWSAAAVIAALLLSPPGFGQETELQKAFRHADAIPTGGWTALPSPGKWKAIEMILEQTRGNYEKIRTWEGTYRVRSVEFQPAAYLKDAFGPRLKLEEVADAQLEMDFQFKFAIDTGTDRIYRSKETKGVVWRTRSSPKTFKVENSAPLDERSSVTPERYLHFDPKAIWPEFKFFRGHPDAMKKRAAFRDEVSRAQRSHISDMIDPRLFFTLTGRQRFWEELNLFLEASQGKNPRYGKEKADANVTVLQAEGTGGQWYQVSIKYSANRPSEKGPQSTIIFSPAGGFNPVEFALNRGDRDRTEVRRTKWRWKAVDGAYVPEAVQETIRRAETPTAAIDRELTLESCAVNRPLREDQFDYAGLGLKDGDIVVDNILNEVSAIRDGGTKKLGNFGEDHSRTVASTGKGFAHWWVVAVNAVVLVAVAALVRSKRGRV